MNFEYQLSKLDEQYFLKERHRRTNIFIYLLFAILYFIFNIPMMIKEFWLYLVIYLFFLILLWGALWLCDFLFTHLELKSRIKMRIEDYPKYHFSVTKRGITQSIGTLKKEVLWKDIRKIKIRKNYIFIEPKNNNVAFLFQKKNLKEKYDELVETIELNIKVK